MEYLNNDKRRLYQILTRFLKQEIDFDQLDHEFFLAYHEEIDDNTFSPLEAQVFEAADDIITWATSCEEDLKNIPGLYLSVEEARNKLALLMSSFLNLKQEGCDGC